jgi:hypothetical protein
MMENGELFTCQIHLQGQCNILYITLKQIPNRVLLLIHYHVMRLYLAPGNRNVCAKPLLGYGFNFIMGILICVNVGYRTSFLMKVPLMRS